MYTDYADYHSDECQNYLIDLVYKKKLTSVQELTSTQRTELVKLALRDYNFKPDELLIKECGVKDLIADFLIGVYTKEQFINELTCKIFAVFINAIDKDILNKRIDYLKSSIEFDKFANSLDKKEKSKVTYVNI